VHHFNMRPSKLARLIIETVVSDHLVDAAGALSIRWLPRKMIVSQHYGGLL
jgi:hypothetical protein